MLSHFYIGIPATQRLRLHLDGEIPTHLHGQPVHLHAATTTKKTLTAAFKNGLEAGTICNRLN